MFGCFLIVYYDYSFVCIYMYVVNLCNRDSVILCIVYVCSLLENFHFVINDNFLQDKGEECQDPPCLFPLGWLAEKLFIDAPEREC